jgi:tripartite-type tricarboxylate transporter receptor subunit TctC
MITVEMLRKLSRVLPSGISKKPLAWVHTPTGVPTAVVATLNTEINKALADRAVRESFLKQAQEPVGGTVEQFSQLFRADYSKYERLMKELNIKVE